MNVLIVGGGAREHALVRALAADAAVDRVVCAPGNAGVAREAAARVVPVDVSKPRALLALAAAEGADLTVVGPELPLAQGVADLLATRAGCCSDRRARRRRSNRARRSPRRSWRATAFRRRGSRCARTSGRRSLRSPETGSGFRSSSRPTGLAAGKGVTVAPDRGVAEAAVREAMVVRRFGDAGATVVIEECLAGPEVSFFAVSDGRRCLALPAAQDHKRIFDGDAGPNTGGMGAFGPSPLFDSGLEARVMREVVAPVLDGLRGEGREYRGVLYVGLMLTTDGPRVIEFNVRFGDPEAQVILPMVESGLAPVLLGAARGDLGDARWRVASDPHVGVVMASGGYPGSYETGRPIDGLDDAAAVPGVHVAHAGTALEGGRIVTSGGRVLTVVARGASYPQAIARAYDAVGRISFDGSHVRTDIGNKALIATESRGGA